MAGFLGNIPTVTKNLIIINLLMFIGTCINPSAMNAAFPLFPLMSHRFHFWQFVTYMFMHGGIWHLFFNMYALFIFGCTIESVIGSKKFLSFYMICGFGAAGLHLLIQELTHSYAPMVGASGSIYGVLIAYAMLFPTSRLTLIFPPVSLSAKAWVLIFIGIELFMGLLSIHNLQDGVAHFAHLGGMLAGFLLVLFWRKSGRLFDKDIWI